MLLQQMNVSEEEIVELLESSAKQGNYKAYYMLGSIYENKLEFTKAQEYLKKGKEAGARCRKGALNKKKNPWRAS